MNLLKRASLLLAFCSSILAAAQKVELHVASAADMHPVFDVIAPMFEQKTGIHLSISYGASAALSQQIINGSPADIFFSADYLFAEHVVAAGLADSDAPTPYARGTLVLWSRKGTPFYPPQLTHLDRSDLKTVAIANPDTAPYGRAAVAALKKMNLYARLQSRIVQADNVMQAAQFAQSGNAQVAFISQTIALSPAFRNAGDFVLVPTYTYPDIRQCAVVMKKSSQRDAAYKLLEFILSSEIQENLVKVGLSKAK